MNQVLSKLYTIAEKSTRRVIGLMSGTSVDGLDIALCRVSGDGKDTQVEVEKFRSVPYEEKVKDALIRLTRSTTVDPGELTVWHDHLARIHAQKVNMTLEEWDLNRKDIDLLASHGHTFHHAPQSKHRMPDKSDATMQIGDGDHIAHYTGIITISDFRQMDIARGGEGAPLAGYGDWLVFGDQHKDRILVNIGGIANLTWLQAGSDRFPPLTYDTGPGNTLMDAVIRDRIPDKSFDEDSALARAGKVDNQVLSALKSHWYFEVTIPKTTGYETFNIGMVEEAGGLELSTEDLLATLNRFTAETIADEIKNIWQNPDQTEILISGGGLYNPLLIENLRELLQPAYVGSTKEIGIDPDAKEAAIFAVLANELICGDDPRLRLGKISLAEIE